MCTGRLTAGSPANRGLTMIKLFKVLKNSESGASAAEYALILAVLGGVIVIALTSFGTKLNTAFTTAGVNLTTGYVAP